MMNKLALAVLFMVGICVAYAQVFTWTDSQGVVHFSDKPHAGAKQIKLPVTQTFSPPANQTAAPPSEAEEDKDIAHKYTKVIINQPLNESTIRNNQGYVVVVVQVEPELSRGDMLQMIFDGSPLGDPQPNLLFQLNGIYRGSHTLAVQVLDSNGNVLATSDAVTIFMHRPRVGMVTGGGAGGGGGRGKKASGSSGSN